MHVVATEAAAAPNERLAVSPGTNGHSPVGVVIPPESERVSQEIRYALDMSEIDAIEAMTGPNTVATLAADLRQLGLDAGMTVLVHTSLSALGWVSGGARSVIQALQEVLTPAGTLVMPAHSGDLSDPQHWQNPPVPESWWTTVRDTIPAFNRRTTPTRGMGIVAEAFRTQLGVMRSHHPQVSFAAWGRWAAQVTKNHPWHYPLGLNSPLDRIRGLGGKVLLLGVGHDRNTSLHLAETLLEGSARREVVDSAPWRVRLGRTEWKNMRNVLWDDGDFVRCGEAFELACPEAVRRGTVGVATARLMDQDTLVSFGVDWLGPHRSPP